jgi:hypothetical protein
MNPVVEEKLPDLMRICQCYGIRRLELFGSAARDDFQPATSDVDFIVTFEESVRPVPFESYLHVGGWFRVWGEGRNGGREQRGSQANVEQSKRQR